MCIQQIGINKSQCRFDGEMRDSTGRGSKVLSMFFCVIFITTIKKNWNLQYRFFTIGKVVIIVSILWKMFKDNPCISIMDIHVTPYNKLTSVVTPLAIDVIIQWIYDGLEDDGTNFIRWFLSP